MTKTLNVQIDDHIFDIINKRRMDNGVASVEEYVKSILLQVAQRIEKETTPISVQKDNTERVKKRLAEMGYL